MHTSDEWRRQSTGGEPSKAADKENPTVAATDSDARLSEPPAFGTAKLVAPGILWCRMPLPFRPDHVNVWLVEDENGFAAVDCGPNTSDVHDAWGGVLRAVMEPLDLRGRGYASHRQQGSWWYWLNRDPHIQHFLQPGLDIPLQFYELGLGGGRLHHHDHLVVACLADPVDNAEILTVAARVLGDNGTNRLGKDIDAPELDHVVVGEPIAQ